jgi:hypothetical protein
MLAACPTFMCGVYYRTPISIIDNFTVDGNQMTITGKFFTSILFNMLKKKKELAGTFCKEIYIENSNSI